MLSLDQVRLLEDRVQKAVVKIQTLDTENSRLRTEMDALRARTSELEGLVRAFKDDQGRIEEGILNALEKLSAFEDSISPETLKYEQIESDSSDGVFISDTNIEIESVDESVDEESTPPSISNGQMDIF